MGEPNVFESLEPLLVDMIPQSIATLKLAEPTCCVRIYYYGTQAPCTYLCLRTISENRRANVFANQRPDVPYYFWGSGEDCGDGQLDLPPDTPNSDADKQLVALFARVYDLLCEDEDAYMVRLREMLQRVSLKLHSVDWSPYCSTTDDFTVVPADGSAHFGDEYEDISKSIPPERLEVLRERGFLGPPDDWWHLPG